MEHCSDREEVEEHLGPQPHVFDQQRGALELAAAVASAAVAEQQQASDAAAAPQPLVSQPDKPALRPATEAAARAAQAAKLSALQ